MVKKRGNLDRRLSSSSPHVKLRIHERNKWFEPNARMCGWDCKPALCHLRTVRILFAVNQNLSVFCAHTKRTGCAGCPFYAPVVLCSPQVREKWINCAPLTHHPTWPAQRVSGALRRSRRVMRKRRTVNSFFANLRRAKDDRCIERTTGTSSSLCVYAKNRQILVHGE